MKTLKILLTITGILFILTSLLLGHLINESINKNISLEMENDNLYYNIWYLNNENTKLEDGIEQYNISNDLL